MPSSRLVRITEGLSFDDVLLVPQYSPLESRSQVDLNVKLGELQFCHPIVPANMTSIASPELVRVSANEGGLVLLHRFHQYPMQYYEWATKDVQLKWRVGVSLGVHEDDKELFHKFNELGVMVFCVDVAHGDSKLARKMCSWIRGKMKKHQVLIAGNVATGLGAVRLWEAGADVVKVGIGAGSLCTTRIETGCGVPQIGALLDVAERRANYSGKGWVISDGGIKNAGDCVKALALSDMVMCGRLFAGCDETRTVMYVGSSTHKTSHVEGVRAMVKPQGPYRKALRRTLEGLRSGCSYQGCALVGQLQENPQFVKITAAGLRESYPHDVQVIREE